MSDTVLITGGLGYVGMRLAEWLLNMSDFSPRLADINIASIPDCLKEAEAMHLDLQSPESLDKCMKGIDCVVHLGGMSVEPESNAWEQVLTANIVGTHNVFEAARRAGVRRMVYASSHHAIGYHRRAHMLVGRVEPGAEPQRVYG